jgi:hypothetical protein
MNFIKELETHLESFESKAKAEIQEFIEFIKTKYSEPADAVVAPPAPIAPNGELTIGQPIVEEPVVEETIPEVVEETTPEVVEVSTES